MNDRYRDGTCHFGLWKRIEGIGGFYGKRKVKDPWEGEDFCKTGVSVHVAASGILEYYFIDLLPGQ